jgi:ethanolamine ammonia-lyase small subunit
MAAEIADAESRSGAANSENNCEQPAAARARHVREVKQLTPCRLAMSAWRPRAHVRTSRRAGVDLATVPSSILHEVMLSAQTWADSEYMGATVPKG